MIKSKELEREALRELLNHPQIGLPPYLADPAAQRRVGKFLADASTQFHSKNHTQGGHGDRS